MKFKTVTYKTVDEINQLIKEGKRIAISTYGWDRVVVRAELETMDLILTSNTIAISALIEKYNFDPEKIVFSECSDKQCIKTIYDMSYMMTLMQGHIPEVMEFAEGDVEVHRLVVGNAPTIREHCKPCSQKHGCITRSMMCE